MNYFFHPEAEEEFLGAIDYYERRAKNLGFEFAIEVYAAIGLATTLSNAWPVLGNLGTVYLFRRISLTLSGADG